MENRAINWQAYQEVANFHINKPYNFQAKLLNQITDDIVVPCGTIFDHKMWGHHIIQKIGFSEQ